MAQVGLGWSFATQWTGGEGRAEGTRVVESLCEAERAGDACSGF